MDKLSKTDPDFFSRISKLRKTFSGGKGFKDPETARKAQLKSVESRRKNAEKETAESNQA